MLEKEKACADGNIENFLRKQESTLKLLLEKSFVPEVCTVALLADLEDCSIQELK